MIDVDTRVAPHDLAAERAVLGAVLVQNDLLDAVSTIVQPGDFYRQSHQVLYTHALRLMERRSAVDLVTLLASLDAAGEMDRINGPAEITALLDGVPHSSNAEHYARIVREHATRRELIAAAQATLTAAYDADEDTRELLDGAQARMFNIVAERQTGGFLPMAEIITREVYPQIETWAEQKRLVTGIGTGLIDFDRMTNGWQPADLIIIAARPSVGKTALALSMAVHAATVEQQHVALCSLEMSRLQLGLRAIVGEARIDSRRIQAGRVSTEDEWARLSQALQRISEARLHIDDQAAVSVADVRTRARKLKASAGLDLLIVDYLQLLRASSRHENRNLDVAEMSAGLKAIGKDLGIPVVALSQLSRGVEGRDEKRPRLSDLRDSGAIEQDADLVVMIYRDEMYHEGSEARGTAELIIEKARNGPTGTVKVGFDASQTRFFNLEAQR